MAHYDVLGISNHKNASFEGIKQAFIKKVLELSKNSVLNLGNDDFITLCIAYKVLSSPDSKKDYDDYLYSAAQYDFCDSCSEYREHIANVTAPQWEDPCVVQKDVNNFLALLPAADQKRIKDSIVSRFDNEAVKQNASEFFKPVCKDSVQVSSESEVKKVFGKK